MIRTLLPWSITNRFWMSWDPDDANWRGAEQLSQPIND